MNKLVGLQVECWRVYQLSNGINKVRIGDLVRIQHPGEIHGSPPRYYTLQGIWAEMKDHVVVWAKPIDHTNLPVVFDIDRKYFSFSLIDRMTYWLRRDSMLHSREILQYPDFS